VPKVIHAATANKRERVGALGVGDVIEHSMLVVGSELQRPPSYGRMVRSRHLAIGACAHRARSGGAVRGFGA